MTATQKENHVAELENLLKKAGATKDRWGNVPHRRKEI